jgi:hypothetical protein
MPSFNDPEAVVQNEAPNGRIVKAWSIAGAKTLEKSP